MAEAVHGKDRILMFRPKSMEGTEAAKKLALQTEHEVSSSRDVESTQTKDGTVRSLGIIEEEISASSLLPQGDVVLDEMEAAYQNGEIIQVWDADLSQAGTAPNTFKGKYFEVYMTEFTQSAGSEDNVEISMTFAVNGVGRKGDVTVPTAIQDAVQYEFKDTAAVTTPVV